MGVRLQVENYRVLRKIDWELPQGVCALVGPNGSGKTTLLDVPVMLGDFLRDGVSNGFDRHGTLDGLRNLEAPKNERMLLTVKEGALEGQTFAGRSLAIRFANFVKLPSLCLDTFSGINQHRGAIHQGR